MRIHGSCHCGRVTFTLTWKPEPTTIPARACTCSFCVKHSGVWTSCPDGSLEVNITDPARVSRYRFGTGTADFDICTTCGVVPVVTSDIEGRVYAVVNVNCFVDVDPTLLDRSSISFDGESETTRLARRAQRWIADVRFASGAPTAPSTRSQSILSIGPSTQPAPAPVPVLRGTRCVLRALVPGDAPSIARHANDPQVAHNLFDGFPQPYTLEHARAWCGDEHRMPAYGHVFAIDVDGDAIGCCGVVPEKGWLRCNAEVGYWVGRTFWRRGIGSEALRLLTAWSWQALPEVMRLHAPIFERNEASQGAARSAGYVLEGRMPCNAYKDGVLIDRVVYAAYRTRHAGS